MRILVTGAQGLLGRQVVAHWLARSPDVEVVGVGRSPRRDGAFTHDLAWCGTRVTAPLPVQLRSAANDARYRYERLDLRDAAAVASLLAQVQPDVVIHTAAALRDEPWASLVESNVNAVVGLLEAVGRSPMARPRIVLTSSGSVYGWTDPAQLPHHEQDVCTPLELYAASKRAAEDVGRVLGDKHDIPVIHGRVFNLLGPGLQDRHLAAAVAGQVAAIALDLAPRLLRIEPLETTRDFIDVRDAAAALALLAERAAPGIYNVASGIEIPVQRVFDKLVDLGGLTGRVAIDELPRRKANMERSFADIGRLEALGFTIQHELGATLGDMLEYYRTQMPVGDTLNRDNSEN
jgi:nucleoside-diphosphate-sugar epimerase